LGRGFEKRLEDGSKGVKKRVEEASISISFPLKTKVDWKDRMGSVGGQ